jgi:hypothetical protein
MPDPILQSVHLEGLSRRDRFRSARARIIHGCSNDTIMGHVDQDISNAAQNHLSEPLEPVVMIAGEPHQLAIGINTIGRLPENQIVIRDAGVSRRHCAIVRHRDGRCELHDVASKNGTLLNGEILTDPVQLKAGDVITLCSHQLVLVFDQSVND